VCVVCVCVVGVCVCVCVCVCEDVWKWWNSRAKSARQQPQRHSLPSVTSLVNGGTGVNHGLMDLVKVSLGERKVCERFTDAVDTMVQMF